MNKKLGILSALLISIAVVETGVLPSGAQDETPPIRVEPITSRGVFTDDVSMRIKVRLDGGRNRVIKVADASHVVVAKITVQPGAQFPWHTHTGPVIVTVTSGELTYVNDNDCVERTYPAGTAFVDPGQGNVHIAFNSSEEVTELVATFLQAGEVAPLTIPVGAEHCEIGVGLRESH